MESHEIQEAQAKAGNPAQSPTGAGQAIRGEENRKADVTVSYIIYKRPEWMNTRAMREEIRRIEEGLKHISDNVNKALNNFDNTRYVKSIISDIINKDRQLLVEYEWLKKLILIKTLKILQYKTNVPVDRIEELRDSPDAHKIIEEIKGPAILARLYTIRDGLKLMINYLSSAPRYLNNDIHVGTVRFMLIDVEKGVNRMLKQLDTLKGLLEELAGYDEKLDHPEQHHNTTH